MRLQALDFLKNHTPIALVIVRLQNIDFRLHLLHQPLQLALFENVIVAVE